MNIQKIEIKITRISGDGHTSFITTDKYPEKDYTKDRIVAHGWNGSLTIKTYSIARLDVLNKTVNIISGNTGITTTNSGKYTSGKNYFLHIGDNTSTNQNNNYYELNYIKLLK